MYYPVLFLQLLQHWKNAVCTTQKIQNLPQNPLYTLHKKLPHQYRSKKALYSKTKKSTTPCLPATAHNRTKIRAHTALHYSLVRSTIKNIAYHSTALYQKFAANAATCTTTTNTQFEHFCLASTFLNSHVHTHGNRPPPTC